jgi:hypothetical protein
MHSFISWFENSRTVPGGENSGIEEKVSFLRQAGIQRLRVLRDPRRRLPPQGVGGGEDDRK